MRRNNKNNVVDELATKIVESNLQKEQENQDNAIEEVFEDEEQKEKVCPNCDKPKKKEKKPKVVKPETEEKKQKLLQSLDKYKTHPLFRKIKPTTKGYSINSVTPSELDDLLQNKMKL